MAHPQDFLCRFRERTEGEAGLATALMVARLWNAHVTAVLVRVEARALAALAGDNLSSRTIKEVIAVTEGEVAARAQALRAMFDRLVSQSGVSVSEIGAGRRHRQRKLR